jgi:hypothetical protein
LSGLAILYMDAAGKEEVGEGLGPTVEFYTLLFREITRKDLRLWMESDEAAPAGAAASPYVFAPHGLHPAPLIVSPDWDDSSATGAPASSRPSCALVPARHTSRSSFSCHHFELLGRIVGKALQERRGIDLPLSHAFLKALLRGPSCATDDSSSSLLSSSPYSASLDDVASFDPSLARSLRSLEGLVARRDAAIAVLRRASGAAAPAPPPDAAEVDAALEALTGLWEEVEMACLDFTVPGRTEVPLTVLPGGVPLAAGDAEALAAADLVLGPLLARLPRERHTTARRACALAFATARAEDKAEWAPQRPVSWFDAAASPAGTPLAEVARGSAAAVTLANLHVYLAGVVRTLCVDGVAAQRDSFLRGLAAFCPAACVLVRGGGGAGGTLLLAGHSLLRIFTPAEVGDLLYGALSIDDARLWSPAAIESALIVGTHYNANSLPVKWLVEALSTLATDDRRRFLKFLTGAPRLPPGGFAALQPARMTVQKAIPSSSSSSSGPPPADRMLPSASTCHVYLKLPPYSSLEVLRAKLLLAIREGNETFDKT